MIQATQLRKGMAVIFEGQIYKIMALQHITPGNWRGMVQAKMRNLHTGSQLEHRFRSEDRVEKAQLDGAEMEFLYSDGSDYHFMNTETYEQVSMSEEQLGDNVYFLIPNIKLVVEMFEKRPIGIEPPLTVDLKVVETEPSIKGAAQGNVTKPAKLETGLTVQVPMFIQEGELITVDTTELKYLSRAKSA
ncbi:MAG: elongation factor P [Acidobacteriota bacterium]